MSAVESSPASTGSHGSSGSGSSDDMMGSGGRRQGRYRARSRSFILEDDEDELPGEVGGGGGAGGGAGRRADHQSSAAAAAAAATANAHRQNRSTKPRQPQVSRSTLRTLCNLSDLPSSPHAAGPPSSAGGGSDSEAAALGNKTAAAAVHIAQQLGADAPPNPACGLPAWVCAFACYRGGSCSCGKTAYAGCWCGCQQQESGRQEG